MARSRSFLAVCLRKRRAELGFSRATAAVKTATSEDVFRKWECGREPLVASYPKIIEFLGRHPWPEPRGLAQQLRRARMARGLPIHEAAAELGVDQSTMWWWETGRKPHRIEDRAKIPRFIAEAIPSVSPPAPEATASPAEVPPVGVLLREQRQALHLTQEEVASQIGADTWTLLSWENGKRTPTDRFYPAIIRFLGRDPWPEPQCLGTRLRAERLRKGLSREQAAAVIQVDPGSISAWEAGRGPLHRHSRAQVEAFLAGTVRPIRKAERLRVSKG